MPTASLTDRKIDSLKPGKGLVEWWDENTPGFGIRVSPKGKKTWFVMYRLAGLRRRLRLGRYPAVSLERARQQARKALFAVSEARDPAQEKKAQEALLKRERLEAKTFSELARLYLDEYAKLNKRSWKEDERFIDKLLKPEFGSLNVKEITRSHVRSFLRGIAAKTRVHANRTHACLRKILNWAIKEEIVDMEGNPASGISSPGGREQSRERVLTDNEIKMVWKELEKDSTAPKKALQLILLTGQRPGEVAGIAFEELNLPEAMWTLPGVRTKNRMTNIVRLSNQAMRVIERQRESLESEREKREKRGHSTPPATFLFPCRHVGKEKPMTVYALDQEAQRVFQELGIPRFTPHDLRRTCSTKLGEMLVPGHIIERIANHKPVGITNRVYNKYDYLKEKQEALNSWGTRLSVIVSDLELVKAENTEI